MSDFLLFRSCGYNFALPANAVASVTADAPSLSFSQLLFGTSEPEPNRIVLAEGYVFRVNTVLEMTSLPGEILPVPGYIFESGNDWLRGIFWGEDSMPVLIMDDAALAAQAASYVPDIPS